MASPSGDFMGVLQSNYMIVTGHANRLVLTHGILEFCGLLPIYNARVIPKDFVWIDGGRGTVGKLEPYLLKQDKVVYGSAPPNVFCLHLIKLHSLKRKYRVCAVLI